MPIEPEEAMSQKRIRIMQNKTLNPGQMVRISVEDQMILLANVEGTLYAIEDQCSHEDASLYNGALKGDCVECPLHGSRFDLKTGQPKEEPATEPVKTFPVERQQDGIYILINASE
jgi:3-phenylpropionate/trans-cinnamate dioxygenase ferredoxin subunit